MPLSGLEKQYGFKLEWIKYFLAVADSESQKKAADTLGVHPSTVCRGMKSLEQALGFELFQYPSDNVELRFQAITRRLTPKGERFSGSSKAAKALPSIS
jgi:DNA-binding transcriptional LysR family regulator